MKKYFSSFLLLFATFLTFANHNDSTDLYVFSYVYSEENVLLITEIVQTEGDINNQVYLLSITSHNRLRLMNHIKSFHPDLAVDPNAIKFQFAANKDKFERPREDLLVENEDRLIELFEFKFDFIRKENLRNVKIE